MRRLAVLSLLFGLLPLAALAQGSLPLTHREWEASFFGGGSFLGEGTYATPVQGSSAGSTRSVGLRYGTGYQLGASIAENRWEHVGAMFEYSFSNQPISFTNLTDTAPSLGLGHSIHRFAYEILYYPTDRRNRLRPFVLAGPGLSLFYVKGPSKDAAAAQGIHLSDPWKFTVNWGGGMKYLVRDQLAASFQFSDSISGVPGYGLPVTGSVVSGNYVPGFRPDGLLHNWLISVRFGYQWDQD